MYSDETQVPRKSRRLLWVGVGLIAVLIIVVIAVSMALGGSVKQEDVSTTDSSQEAEESVATNEEVKQNLTDLEKAMNDAKNDQASAKASLDESKKQIKVGS